MFKRDTHADMYGLCMLLNTKRYCHIARTNGTGWQKKGSLIDWKEGRKGGRKDEELLVH